jgi:hypothetical protein
MNKVAAILYLICISLLVNFGTAGVWFRGENGRDF